MGTSLPPHLQDLPPIRDRDLLLDTFDDEELVEFTRKANDLLRRNGLPEDPTGPSYLVLGNYDDGAPARDGPRDRLEDARAVLHGNRASSFAVLLDDLDPANARWHNWYLKFQFTVHSTDYNVVVAEDCDGGHVLELGEVPLRETHVLKREYGHASLDRDLEYQKFDGMTATLFEFLHRTGRLRRWRDRDELLDAVVRVTLETTRRTPVDD